MKSRLATVLSILCTSCVLIACSEDVSIGRNTQAVSNGMTLEGFCTPAHCSNYSYACGPTRDGRSRHVANERCIPNEPIGSAVGTCRIEADCVPDSPDPGCDVDVSDDAGDPCPLEECYGQDISCKTGTATDVRCVATGSEGCFAVCSVAFECE